MSQTQIRSGLRAGCKAPHVCHVFRSAYSGRSLSQPARSQGPLMQRRSQQDVQCAQGPNRPQQPRGNRNNSSRGRGPPRGPYRGPPRGPPRQQQPLPQINVTMQKGRTGRQSSDDPPMNSDITCHEVRVLDSKKEMLGVMPTSQAQDLAEEQDVDLVLINPDVEPPLARLVELNKLKYEAAKADQNQRKKQRESRQELKELKFRPNTDVHDYNVRLKNAKKFLSKGDKVKLTMQFKGREMEFKNLGREMFQRFVDDLGEQATVAQTASMQGYSMTLIVTPNRK